MSVRQESARQETARLADARIVLEAGSMLLADAVSAAKRLTADGAAIDDHQVVTERVAYAATEAVAAHEVLAELERWRTEGNATPIRLMDYIETIEKAIGKTAVKNMLGMQPGDVKQTFADVRLLKALTGYTPNTDYRVGIPAFVDWFRSYYKPA